MCHFATRGSRSMSVRHVRSGVGLAPADERQLRAVMMMTEGTLFQMPLATSVGASASTKVTSQLHSVWATECSLAERHQHTPVWATEADNV